VTSVEQPQRQGQRRPSAERELWVIEPRHTGPLAQLREFWRYRGLVPFFGRRYIQKRYVRTWLGRFWLPLRPAMAVSSSVLVFGGLLSVPSGGVPYLIFFLVGSSAWHLFAETAYWATRSVELNRGALGRMYIPRLTVLVAAVAPSILDYLIYSAITALAVLAYLLADGTLYLELGPENLVALAGLGLIMLLALGIGLWTSVYAVQARDVRFGLSYLLSFWFFLTPVIYPLEAVPERYQDALAANPMTAPIEMVKDGFLGAGDVTPAALSVTIVTVLVVCGRGLFFFGRSEARALDSL
jgi:lipopolysaccharide transport system permease protein